MKAIIADPFFGFKSFPGKYPDRHNHYTRGLDFPCCMCDGEKMESIVIMLLLAGPLIGSLVGLARGRLFFGFFLGLLLGPIGWIIVALCTDLRHKCPACFGSIDPRATVCRHCGTRLAAPVQVTTVDDWKNQYVDLTHE